MPFSLSPCLAASRYRSRSLSLKIIQTSPTLQRLPGRCHPSPNCLSKGPSCRPFLTRFRSVSRLGARSVRSPFRPASAAVGSSALRKPNSSPVSTSRPSRTSSAPAVYLLALRDGSLRSFIEFTCQARAVLLEVKLLQALKPSHDSGLGEMRRDLRATSYHAMLADCDQIGRASCR